MNQLIPVEYKSQRILTTAQLAEAYGVDSQLIVNNFNRNRDRYKEDKHYYTLEGETKRQFIDQHQIDLGSKNAKTIYLWTEKGAWLHAKSLNTDQSWDAYESLVDDYYEKIETLNKVVDELESLRETMRVANESATLLSGLIESAGLNSNVKLLTAKVIYRHLGIELPIEIGIDSKLYDTREIAKKLGMYSEAGKPAYHAVGAIIRKLNINDDEKQVVLESTGPWQGTVIKYKESVLKKVRQWLEDNNYPMQIPTITEKGAAKIYRVKFQAS